MLKRITLHRSINHDKTTGGRLRKMCACSINYELLTIIGPIGSFIAPGGPMTVFGGGTLFGVFFFALGLDLALPDRGPDPGPDREPDRGPGASAPDQFTPE